MSVPLSLMWKIRNPELPNLSPDEAARMLEAWGKQFSPETVIVTHSPNTFTIPQLVMEIMAQTTVGVWVRTMIEKCGLPPPETIPLTINKIRGNIREQFTATAPRRTAS